MPTGVNDPRLEGHISINSVNLGLLPWSSTNHFLLYVYKQTDYSLLYCVFHVANLNRIKLNEFVYEIEFDRVCYVTFRLFTHCNANTISLD